MGYVACLLGALAVAVVGGPAALAQALPEHGPGLWVGGRQITDPRELDLPPLSKLRREAVAAMIQSTRAFDFADLNQLRWTIELRLKLIALMEAVRPGQDGCRAVGAGQVRPPASWELYPEPAASMRDAQRTPVALRARSEVASAHAAVAAFRAEPSTVDCLAGIELTILDAADRVLGERNFDHSHPPMTWPALAASDPAGGGRPYVLIGLGVPLLTVGPERVTDNAARSSLASHLAIVRHLGGPPGDPLAAAISGDDMIPGDYARLGDPAGGGAAAGEDVVYLGRGRSGAAYFYAYGRADPDAPEHSRLLSETLLRDGLAAARQPPADPAALQWALLGGPVLYGDPRHAGRFVQP